MSLDIKPEEPAKPEAPPTPANDGPGNVSWMKAPFKSKQSAAPLNARAQLVDELSAPATKSVRLTRWVAGIAFLVIFVIATIWPITSGVVAQGQLATRVGRQQIQHPTGGVVKAIFVKEGMHVKAGEVLMKLEPVEAGANAGIAAAQLESLQAQSAVRGAEVGGAKDVTLPDGIDSGAGPIIAAQRDAFEARQHKNAIVREQIDAQRAQIRAEIAGAQAGVVSQQVQLDRYQKELESYNRLLAEGLVEKTRVWGTERAIADIQGRIASSRADVARLRAQDVELRAKREQIDADAKVQAAEDLGDIQRDLAAAKNRYDVAADSLKRTELDAPVSGTVMHMASTTIGGVIRPAETVMEIVPDEGELIVRARVNPKDADDVRAGAVATVRFDSLGVRYAPRLKGSVVSISADALSDERTGQAYFEARISIPPSETKQLPKGAFEPGLPAEVLIQTGEHTLFAYLLGPIDRAAFKAMRN